MTLNAFLGLLPNLADLPSTEKHLLSPLRVEDDSEGGCHVDWLPCCVIKYVLSSLIGLVTVNEFNFIGLFWSLSVDGVVIKRLLNAGFERHYAAKLIAMRNIFNFKEVVVFRVDRACKGCQPLEKTEF